MTPRLAQLPDELLADICHYLNDPTDVYRLSLADRRWRRLATSDVSSPWQTFLLTWWRGLGEGSSDWSDVARRVRDRVRKRKLRELVKEDCRNARHSRIADEDPPRLFSVERLLDNRGWSEPSFDNNSTSYYNFCRRRLNTEDLFLQMAKHHVQNLTRGQVTSALDILRETGSEIRDFLHLLIWDQSICSISDSWSSFTGNEEWIRAREVHLRAMNGFAKPHERYHLALCELARSLLHHLQKREAIETCRLVRRQEFEAKLWREKVRGAQDEVDHDGRTISEVCRESSEQVEEALCAIAQFRGGEKRMISEYLDLLAVYIYLKLRSHPEPLATTRSVVMAIFTHLKELSYGSASPIDFLDLDNSFLHISLFCPHNRATLPLTLTAIFISVASRLGISAGISNLPGRIVAIVVESSSNSTTTTTTDASPASPLSRTFFVDGTRLPDSPIREPSDVVEWSAMVGMRGSIKFADMNWTPATGAAIMERSAQNILNATQNGRDAPRIFHVMRQRAPGSADTDDPGDSETQPRLSPTAALQEYLTSHPASANRKQPSQLPLEVRPLDKIYAHWLPTSRPSTLDQEASREGTYCAAWILTELSPHTLGEAGLGFLMTDMARDNKLDVVFSTIGQREFAKIAKRQRALSYARRRQGTVGVHSSDEEDDDEDILPVLPGQEEIQSTPTTNDNDSSDDDEEEDASDQDTDERSEPTPTNGSQTDTSRVFKLHIPRLFAADLSIPRSSPHISSTRPLKVLHTVGTLFEHRAYGYRAVITGWDPECHAEEAWMRQMGVDVLPDGGRNQPFYNVTVEDGTERYVAQCNVKAVTGDDTSTTRSFLQDFNSLFQVRGIGNHFRCVDVKRRRLRKTKKTRAIWGNEGSDSEDDGRQEHGTG